MRLDRRDLLLSAGAAGLLAAAPGALAQTPAAPDTADQALGRHLDDLAERLLIKTPETATSLGLDKDARAGLKGQLSDAAWANVLDDRGFCRDGLRALEAFPDSALSPQARIHKGVVAYALKLGADAAPFDYGDNTLASAMSESSTPYVVSQQDGAYAAVPEFLDSQHAIETEDDADDYLSRLHELSQVLAEETDRIRKDDRLGVVPPDFILANILGQQQGLLAIRPGQSRLVTSLARRAREKQLSGDLEARATRLVETEVYPALAQQYETLKGLAPRAGRDAGVWRLPQGEAYYRWLLREGTSTSLTADEIHRIGLEQNRAIEARMDGLLRARGLAQGTVGERMTALGRDPKHLFPDTDAGRAQLIDYLNGVIAAMRPKLSQAFTLRLKAPIEVKRVPVEIEDGAGQGYMNFGSLDGSRPSTYYINLKTTQNWPKFSLPTLTFHEGVPGHAWTGAYLTETGKMPLIRIILSGFNAYIEGYALYAEQLADEIGMYDADWAGRLGYLQAQRFRAVRLVVDTGLHAKRWTRDQAIQWAVDNTGRARDAMTSEIDRYCATPGQACGYKIGHTEINRMRDKARAAFGPRFDVRRFNDLLVQTGSVPMDVLSATVDGWIASGGQMRL
ncbi:DUF885 domain-containing protein [Phenylobacterium sp.]|uniref:DUF885 domain-containing protein n=1 Tax=Phenylobacterium sp. TaxID=1871053 RepID=UPI002C41E6DB|nr:DUF885 domain-containing protein [Phenylobacterium sp.]HVI34013.1 DUF885 domain-containing protein [Phenylobacterium sp.]